MANEQFNEQNEYKGHYYDGLKQIAENMVPRPEVSISAPEPEDENEDTQVTPG